MPSILLRSATGSTGHLKYLYGKTRLASIISKRTTLHLCFVVPFNVNEDSGYNIKQDVI